MQAAALDPVVKPRDDSRKPRDDSRKPRDDSRSINANVIPRLDRGIQKAPSSLLTRTLFTALLASLLTACATTQPASKPANNQTMTWQQRQHQLARVHTWRLSGALAMRLPHRAFSASLNWQQKSSRNYLINLFGPLGVGAVRITGTSRLVTLKESNGKTYQARSAQTLMQKNLGWAIPVNNLYFWVRGLPAPGASSHLTFDRYHHLTQLRQSGWRIRFSSYTAKGSYDLPNKIQFSSHNLSGTLIISRWQTLG